jgi:hypothetical protein
VCGAGDDFVEPDVNRTGRVFRIAMIVVLFGLLIGLTYVNYQFAERSPGGNDFLARWTGAHYWLVEGINPYDERVGSEAQRMIYGRPADIEAGEDLANFVYPLPAMIFFAPFGLLPYTTARALWMTILEVALPVLAVMGLRLARWRTAAATTAFVLLFSIFWYHGIRSIVVGQFAVVEALLLIGALLAIQEQNDILSGVLLALSIAKPQMAFLLIPFILFWGATRRRWRLIGATFGSLTVLIMGSILIMPDWPIRWLTQLVAYPDYTALGSPVSIFVGLVPGAGQNFERVLVGALALYMLYEWIAARQAEDRHFQWTSAMTLAITNLIAFRTATTNYVVLLPPILLVFSSFQSRWRGRGTAAVWGIMALLLAGLWWLFLATVDGNVESLWMYFPVPVLSFLGLLWVRWWVVRGGRLPIGSRFA